MKKLVLAVMAVAAIGFTSCGNKTQQAEAVDSVELVSEAAATADIDALNWQLQSGDVSKFQAALDAVKERIATLIKENPETAKMYIAKVQDFLKENAEKVKEVVGDNAAVAAAVSAITEVEPASVISGFLSAVDSTANSAKDAAVDAANQAVDDAKQAVEDKANKVKDAAKQKANDAIDNAAKDVKKGIGL